MQSSKKGQMNLDWLTRRGLFLPESALSSRSTVRSESNRVRRGWLVKGAGGRRWEMKSGVFFAPSARLPRPCPKARDKEYNASRAFVEPFPFDHSACCLLEKVDFAGLANWSQGSDQLPFHRVLTIMI